MNWRKGETPGQGRWLGASAPSSDSMELTLTRITLAASCTEGWLAVNGTPECATLELPVKDGLPGSAIPPGKYLIMLLPSPKFERSTDPWVLQYAGKIPHVLGIPSRSEILIHWGNTAADTEGCILVGSSNEGGTDFIGNSRVTFAALWQQLVAVGAEPITLQINGGIPETPNNSRDVQEAIDPG